MREILFRGKRIDKNEWVEGDLIHLPNGIAILANGYAYVIPETVGQYTGLKDKNGKMIFEGDIVQSCASENEKDWKVWVIAYDDGCFSFESNSYVLKTKRKFKSETNLLCEDEISLYGLIIIGNIHDNPELLEAES